MADKIKIVILVHLAEQIFVDKQARRIISCKKVYTGERELLRPEK